MEIINAKIHDTFLGYDHGNLVYGLMLFDSVGIIEFGRRAAGRDNIIRILDIVGVERWEDLKNQYIRIKVDDTVIAIGHIIKDKWYNPEGDK